MHVMLDLETLATDVNAQIVSIGAVKFDKTGLGSTFYKTILLEDNSSFSVNAQTVGFWLKQTKESQEALFFNPQKIQDVLKDFRDWYEGPWTRDQQEYTICFKERGKKVWGNGVNFDNTILRNAFEKCSMTCPFTFKEDMCYRTVVALNKHRDIPFERMGEHHNSLDDAKSQAKYLIALGVLDV